MLKVEAHVATAAVASTRSKMSLGLIAVILTLAFAMTLFVGGCSAQDNGSPAQADKPDTNAQASADATDEQKPAPTDVRVLALKGPTAMGLVQFFNEVDDANVSTNNFSYSIASAPDEVTAAVAKGDVDIAAVPANVAAVLYNNTKGGVQVLNVNTLGVLYIVQNGDAITSIEQLKGKTIYASGKGATPEYALNYILQENNLVVGTDVQIEWLPEHTAVVTSLMSNPESLGMLPQPFATTAQSQNENLKIAFDLNEEWTKATSDSTLITGVAIVRTEFAKEHPEAVADFMQRYAESVAFVNANTEDAAKLVGKYDIVPEAVALKALPKCNIVYIDGSELKTLLGGYLQTIFDQNPQAVGGTLPDDVFYYQK
ncbi:MAG: PhnD/SsuA/transferrin family substrate-binding protein [Coriobacteriales bacterium]|nr:PhnD/SsuA/transferrin family substrate-binding protein [Coriobacteriales bacterium]